MAVGGEGGMLTTTKAAYAEKISGITNHGRSPNLEAMELGSNLRMSEVSAAIGLVQLEHLDGWVQRRNAIAARYTDALAGHPHLSPPSVRPGAYHAWHQYCIQTDHASAFVAHMDRNDIDARRYYTTPIHCQQVFQNHPQYQTTLPVTDHLGQTLVAIPVMHELHEEEIERILQALRAFNPV
jgi:perosamine synthetase